jgi:DNA repair exonuclease SbcCD ATPase subunit
MLEIAKFSWSNYLSFGDYVSTVDLTNLKECFITGTIEDENGNLLDGRSNGAGKSNVISALQWTLFGRTTHSANPGNKIRNWGSKADTWGKVVLENGDNILRTCTADGTTEVTFYHAGEETCATADTLGTLKAQQAKLNQAFKLDWDIFSKSVFFSCFDKPWLQMSDQKRKEVLEKLLKLDRLGYYAKSAQARAGADTRDLETQKTEISSRIRFLTDLKTQTEAQKNAADQFEVNRTNRINAKIQQKNDTQVQLDQCQVYDIELVRGCWERYNALKAQMTEKINAIQTNRTKTANSYNYSMRRVADLQREIMAWESKKGTTCASCGQPVADGHVHEQTTPKSEEKASLESTLPDQAGQIEAMDAMIAKVQKVMVEQAPKIELSVVEANERYRVSLQHQIQGFDAEIVRIQEEVAPNVQAMDELKSSLGRIKQEIGECQKKVGILEERIIHLEYIRKAYSDRSKVKRDIVGQHIPLINERLRYYLDVMELEVKVQLTDSLGVESNYWGYDFQSNGEKRRTDVAMMLATYDLHEQLYGRQCNMLVLDEVDGQMDRQGINALIHIIKNDLVNRAGSVFIISHNNTMQSVFGSEIKVRKRAKLSYLES